MTVNVPKGANRPYAAGKRARASQTTMLPLKTQAQQDAHTAEVQAARIELQKRLIEQATSTDSALQKDAGWQAAQAFCSVAEHHDWRVIGNVTSYVSGGSKRTIVVTRGEDRLSVSWFGAEPLAVPLFQSNGRNQRLMGISEAMERLYAVPNAQAGTTTPLAL